MQNYVARCEQMSAQSTTMDSTIDEVLQVATFVELFGDHWKPPFWSPSLCAADKGRPHMAPSYIGYFARVRFAAKLKVNEEIERRQGIHSTTYKSEQEQRPEKPQFGWRGGLVLWKERPQKGGMVKEELRKVKK